MARTDFLRSETRSLALGLTLAATTLVTSAHAGVKFTGTNPAQRTKLAGALTRVAGVTVTISATGDLSLPATGGNAVATRLRTMSTTVPNVTLRLVNSDGTVSYGGWKSSVAGNIYGPTTGEQCIDIEDLCKIGNVLPTWGFSIGSKLMHEITEVWEGKKSGSNYHAAHAHGVNAEKECMAAHNTSWVGTRYVRSGGKLYMRIKRPDGSKVMVEFTPWSACQKAKWFREDTTSVTGWKAIADPDPEVHIAEDFFDGNHSFGFSVDTVGSRPTGVAFDPDGLLWITEDYPDPFAVDEVRVFDLAGVQITSFPLAQSSDPQGIDIDPASGDVYIAMNNLVARFDAGFNFAGAYFDAQNPGFRPTDVAFPREAATDDLPPVPTTGIYVTDRNSSQVYHFDIAGDLNTGTFQNAFGGGLLVQPEGLDVGDGGGVWVASSGNDRIYLFDQMGQLVPSLTSPYFVQDSSQLFLDVLAVDGDGVYAVDGTSGVGKMLRYDYMGVQTNTYGAGVAHCPAALAKRVEVHLSNLTEIPDPGELEPLGTEYCIPAVPNTTGLPAVIGAFGSPLAVENDMTLTATQLPPGQFGYFITSRTQGFVSGPGGSAGDLCLRGTLGRFVQQVQNSGPAGAFSIPVDLTAMPVSPTVPVLPGESWNFQCWYRDRGTSNFSSGLEVSFL